MHIKKHLSFKALRKQLSVRFREITDHRDKNKTDYTIHDCAMSGFAMMFFQDPSVVTFQERIQQALDCNNLKSLFDVESLPKSTQMRDVLDEIESQKIAQVINDYFKQLQRGKHLESYQFIPGYHLVTIDGSEYFSSEKISCPACLTKQSKKSKTVRHHHQILQAALISPDKKQVIPFAPEFIRNTDGQDKQDCEVQAGKRLIRNLRKTHPKLKMILVGDGLYSKQPFIEQLKTARMSYILVAKPTDHKLLMEWVNEQKDMENVFTVKQTDTKGVTTVYEWINNVPLNGNKETEWVNYFRYHVIKSGKITSQNSWVTDIEINESNIAQMVRAGRARWKIENEGFNTLKNQGYHIDHNFGHGKKNLSSNFFLLNLLAFMMHQIFELTDALYQSCREKFCSKVELWNNLKYILRLFLFINWEQMLRHAHSPPEINSPCPA